MGEVKSARVTSPGRIIKRELDARGWTQQDLSEIMDRPPQAISEIIRGKKQITVDTAIQLAKAFGTSPELWLNLEMNYRLSLANQGSDEEITRKSYLFSKFPVRDLIKRGWIEGSRNIDELESQILSILGIGNISDLAAPSYSFRKTTTKEMNLLAGEIWLHRVIDLASNQKVPLFDLETFTQKITELLDFSETEKDIEKIPHWFNENGVRFVVLKHLPGTYLDGAMISGLKNPLIALTLRYDRIDNFWFTLMHEVAHLIKGHGTVLDDLENPISHVAEEEEVNRWAMDTLIDQEELNDFIGKNSPYFSKLAIQEFSKQIRRHPGIVIGQLHKKGEIPYRNFREFLVKASPSLGNMYL